MGLSEPDLLERLSILEKDYGYAFRLVSKDEAEKIQRKYKTVHYKDIVWSEQDDDTDIYYIDMPPDKSVLIGPIEYKSLEVVAIVTIISIFFIAISGALFVWLWPLWRDHKRLDQSATAFGAGHLDSRVSIKKFVGS